ncbi:rod-binding protein [Pontivivens nitratireducens]|uniref:Flagellar protein FlgJ N-terminal domain-containing protein n=1 Tax=Pontivivens nitratireducens TaxID=2758038 RepID=A0A6G7VKR1_9RHOB|nr:rod-binding protein [Pontibrevibacter nitratireducens]QIK40611.1 hypothetical protein G8E03_07425 [Pontibrevibacter nitratireducens]
MLSEITLHDSAVPRVQEAALRRTAVEFEASFLAEMLSHSGFGAARTEQGGGAGEDAFASLLAREHAKVFAQKGGIGLADRIFESLVQSSEAVR